MDCPVGNSLFATLSSGINKFAGIQSDWALYSWFSTSFEVSPSWKGEQVLLNFGAVDYEATVFINGQNAGFNRGGYFRFVVDVTQYLKFDQPNELLVSRDHNTVDLHI